MKQIHILGTGCPKCKKLASSVESVAYDNGIEIKLEKITNINEILSYGIIMTPALVVDGDVKVSGRVPKNTEILELLQ